MSKKPSGKDRSGEGKKKPIPSNIKGTAGSGKSPPQKGRRNPNEKSSGSAKSTPQPVRKISNTSLKKNRSKNSIKMNDAGSYKEDMAFQGEIDKSAENMLKRPPRESGLHYVKPLPPAKEPRSPYKRKVLRVLFYAVTLLVLVSVCFVLSLTVFFKIDEIEVKGKSRYSGDEIKSSCMIKQGDNLILCNTSPGEKNIWEKFPYIEKVTISKELFNRIVITVKEATPTCVIESEGKYVLLSESGKIIDISDTLRNTNIPKIMGAKLKEPKLSSAVKYKDENVEGYINEILDAEEKYKLGTIDIIDISNMSKITLTTKQGLRIVIGTPESIDYKLKTAKKIIEKSLSEKDKGILDVSLCSAEGGKSYYSSQADESSAQASKVSKPKTTSDTKKKTESSSESSKAEESGANEDETSDADTGDPETTGEETDDETTYDDGEYTDDDGTDDDGEYTDDDGTYDDGEYTDDDGTDDDGEYTDDDGTDDDGEYTDDDGTYDDGEYTDDDGTDEDYDFGDAYYYEEDEDYADDETYDYTGDEYYEE